MNKKLIENITKSKNDGKVNEDLKDIIFNKVKEISERYNFNNFNELDVSIMEASAINKCINTILEFKLENPEIAEPYVTNIIRSSFASSIVKFKKSKTK